jgi:predicted nucleic acid-binding protein
VRLVVDASVAVEYLLRTPTGRAAAPQLALADIFAPELLDAEVLATLRKAVLRGGVTVERAEQALADLALWPVSRLSHVPLLPLAWSLRGNVTGYDALYVAAARLVGAPLITADGRLARAPGLGTPVQFIRT